MKSTIQEIQEGIRQLLAELGKPEASLPGNSLRSHQLIIIKELE